MKSKKAIVIVSILAVLILIPVWILTQTSLVGHPLAKEWIESPFPQKLDDDTILPFGYTLGSWPEYFEEEPIVTRLTYQKGPPKKFIEKIVQIWRPVEVELQIGGPRTLLEGMTASDWRSCFESTLQCRGLKQKFMEQIFPDEKLHREDEKELTWFDSLNEYAPRGTHLRIQAATYRIDRYTVITQKGATQTFSLKTVKGPIGEKARELLIKTLGGLKVKEDLQNSRAWIQAKIQSVNLDEVRKIQDPKKRLVRLIQIQNWIYSLLTVDPTHVEPFFHLAGVTHLLAMEMLKSKQTYFPNQEAWILSLKPLFETLLAYMKDFPDSEAASKNIESLLEDLLFEQSKLSH